MILLGNGFEARRVDEIKKPGQLLAQLMMHQVDYINASRGAHVTKSEVHNTCNQSQPKEIACNKGQPRQITCNKSQTKKNCMQQRPTQTERSE